MLNNESFVQPDASEIINSQEIDEIINKLGSFIAITSNKPVSCVTMFLTIVKTPVLKDILEELTQSTWYEIVAHLGYRYPILTKSKKIK